MDYKERYKGALECAKVLSLYQDSFTKNDLERIFPELKEISMRERLIKAFGTVDKTKWEGIEVKDILAWLEKQGEKKSDNKVKLKFKIGDFIVNDYCVGKVVALTNDTYLLDTGICIPFSCEHDFHIWNIKDAKKGDVLASKDTSNILIFKNLDTGTSFSSYYNLERRGETGWSNQCFVPASKEQRNILFQAMKQAGYTFDFVKKELNKIIQY